MPVTVALKFVEKIDPGNKLRFQFDVFDSLDPNAPSTVPTAPTLMLIRFRPNKKGGVNPVTAAMFVTQPDDHGGFKNIAGSDKAKDVTFQPPGTPEVGPSRVRWRVFLEVAAGSGALAVKKNGADITPPIQLGVQAAQVNTTKPSQQTMGGPGFPRLSVGINATPQNEPVAPPGPLDLGNLAAIKYVSDYVVTRLRTPRFKKGSGNRPDALWELWDAEKAPLGQIPQTLPSNNKPGAAQELWARQISEMLLLSLYGGPGVLHLFDGKGDTELLGDVFGGRGSNKCYPLTFACQHLSAAGIASRGEALLRGKTYGLVNAGHSTASTVTNMGGAWIVGNPTPIVAPNLSPASALTPDQGAHDAPLIFDITAKKLGGCTFEPPAVFVFANRAVKAASLKLVPKNAADPNSPKVKQGIEVAGGREMEWKAGELVADWTIAKNDPGFLADNTALAHIGFVLRVDPATKKYQTFDTGGLGGSSAPQSLFPTTDPFHGGNFDYAAVTTVKGGDPYRGCGAFPPMSDSDADALEKQVENTLKQVRPLGFARLFLVARGASITMRSLATLKSSGLLIYVSPVVRMWAEDDDMLVTSKNVGNADDNKAAAAEDKDRQNFSIARYLWSLRMFPGRDAVEPMWFIYGARGALARTMMKANRSDRIAKLAADTVATIKKKPERFLDKKTKAVDASKVLAEFSLLTHILTGNADGTVSVKFKFNAKETKLPPALHLAERPSWDGSVVLRPDETFLQGSAKPSGFANYLTQP